MLSLKQLIKAGFTTRQGKALLQLTPSSAGGLDALEAVALIVYAPGDTLGGIARASRRSVYVDGEGTHQAWMSACHFMPNCSEGATFTLRQLVAAGVDTPEVSINSPQLVVSNLTGTERIVAYAARTVLPARVGFPEGNNPSDFPVISLTSSYDVVGTDLSVVDGSVVSAAGGDFLVQIDAYCHLVTADPL